MHGTILLLDHSFYERQKMRHVIEKIGSFNIVEVGSIMQFKLLDINIGDLKLIILDLAFPNESDGFEALHKIRTDNETVPVIIVTQSDSPNIRSEALKYRVSDYILKPYQIKRLESSISSCVSIKNSFHYDTGSISDIKMSFDDYVDREIKYSKRTGSPLSFILITALQIGQKSEISLSKALIESVLKVAAQKAKMALRATDTIVLNKDRDIIIVLPCTDESGAALVSNKIKSFIEPEFKKINDNLIKYFYPVYVTFPKDGEDFQALMETAFNKVSAKEMLEKIVSIPADTRKYIDKSYNRYMKWF
jgi:DNA-binding NarL/FixJ family response regulator